MSEEGADLGTMQIVMAYKFEGDWKRVPCSSSREREDKKENDNVYFTFNSTQKRNKNRLDYVRATLYSCEAEIY